MSALVTALTVIRRLLVGFAASALPWPVMAQEVLPRPEPPFNGVIGETYKDSTPDKIPLIRAPDGAPNILVVLIDDSGFGQWSAFGGLIPTPNLDRLAASGLRYIRCRGLFLVDVVDDLVREASR